MPDERILGDLSPVPLYTEEAGEEERLTENIENAQPDELEEQYAGMSSMELDSFMRAEMGSEIESFEAAVATAIYQAKERMLEARQRMGVDERWDREQDKFRAQQRPRVKADGTIDPEGLYSHLKCGLSNGLFQENCTTIPSVLERYILAPDRRPYELHAKGKRQENTLKQDTVYALADRQIEQARWRGEVKSMLNDLPKHGTGILRQSWREETGWCRGRDGNWIERVVFEGMSIKRWSLLDVFVSNPGRAYAWEQDSIIWFSRITLTDLLREQKGFRVGTTIGIDRQTGMPVIKPDVQTPGRFFGLERFQREKGGTHNTQAEDRGQLIFDTGTTNEQDQDGFVTHLEAFSLWEHQGYFPLGAMIRNGTLTRRMLQYYGLMFETPQGPIEDLEEIARLCDQVMWYISIVTESGGSAGHLVELRPCPYKEQRNEMLAGVLVRDGSRFYGLSSESLASYLEDAADKVLNDIVDILDNNANPPRGIAPNAFTTEDEAREQLNSRDRLFFVKGGGLLPKDAVHEYLRTWDPNMYEVLDRLTSEYNTRTMISGLAKGGEAQTESDTLGEARQQLSRVEQRLVSVVYELAETTVVSRSLECLLQDMDFFYSDEKIAAEARKLAGEKGLDSESIFIQGGQGDSMFDLSDEFRIKSSAATTIESEVAIQFILKVAAEHADLPTIQREKMIERAFSLMGIGSDEFFIDATGPMAPRRELEMIMAGDKPTPDPMEDAMAHLFEHQNQLMFLQQTLVQHQAMGEPIDAIEGWIRVLQEHILETTDLAQQQMMMMQQQMMAQQQAQEGAGGSSEGEGGSEPMQPPQGAQILSGIQSNANAAMPRTGGMRT